MTFHISKFVKYGFDEAVSRARDELQKEGFGVLTEIDARATLKEKLDVEFRDYLILGACNPPFAHRALEADDKIGVLLPCNVVIQKHEDGRVEVSAMDPAVMSQATGNSNLDEIAGEVAARIRRVMQAL